MAGRRGARSGRGWDALPPRPARRAPDGDLSDEHPPGEPSGGATERGNVPARRRRGSPGGFPRARDADDHGAHGGSVSEPADDERGVGRGSAGGRADGERGVGRGFAGGRADGERGVGRGSPGGRAAEQSEPERAREICLRKLALRPCTRAELAKALSSRGISDEVIAEVLDRYDEVGLIDDAAFARAWVSSRHHGRGLARRALANELRQRGVSPEIAGEALDTLDEEDEAATARILVDRKLRSASGSPEAVFRRLVGMLARKGYPPGVAIRTVKEALAARYAEAAELADQIDPDAMPDEV
jgi:regulatory protein